MSKGTVHLSAILKEELAKVGISPTEFARQIDLPPCRIRQIISCKRDITAGSALRFGHWFGTSPSFWLNLQAQFDLAAAYKECGASVRKLPTRETMTA